MQFIFKNVFVMSLLLCEQTIEVAIKLMLKQDYNILLCFIENLLG